MLDSLIEALQSAFYELHPSADSRGRLEIQNSGLPDAVSSFLLTDLERVTTAEVRSHDPSTLTWVDGEHQDVSRLFDAFAEVAIGNARIPAAEWRQCLRRATASAVHAVVDPRNTLTHFVFADSQTPLPLNTVLSRLETFPTHPELRQAVSESLVKKGSDSLSRERLRSVVDKVDDLRTDGYGARQWLGELKPLYVLLESAGLEERISTEEVARFLTARDCPAEAERLLAYGGQRISFSEAANVLAEAELEKTSEPGAESARPSADAAAAATETPNSRAASAAKPGAEGAVPLWRRYQKNLNAPIGTSAARSSAPEPESDGPRQADVSKRERMEAVARPAASHESAERSQQPLWQKYRSGAPAESVTGPNLHEMELYVLGKDAARNRDTFIGQLFQGREDEYMRILRKLLDAASWSEASRVIADQVFKKHQINIYSEPAVAFTNAVEARYRSKRVDA